MLDSPQFNRTHHDDGGEGMRIVYCRSWCPDCHRAKSWLASHNIAYIERDVDEDPAARARAAGFNDGTLHTPTFEHTDGICVDFRPDRIRELLSMP
jgi:glutaredoxin